MQHDDTIISFEAAAKLRDLVIREQEAGVAHTHPIDMQVFHIRMASTAGGREAASLLLRKMYGWRGYDVDADSEHAPNRITLYAETGGHTVGTMSLCLDDAEIGLPDRKSVV